MAIKQVVLSDISAVELDDSTHARVVIEHPDTNFPIELDVSTDEAGKFANSTLRLVTVTVHAPNQPVRTVTVETKTLDKLFGEVKFEDVLASGRKVQRSAPEPARRAVRGTGAAKADKRDYTTTEWAGSVKRGKISPAEKATVKAHLDEVNKNLAARGERTIDPKNPEHKEKYGL